MADKAITELVAAEKITATDLFVLQQNNTAKKLPGQVLLNWLTAAADGHGGIQSIVKKSTSGLVDTYRITLADTTTFDFVVTNGRSVNSISKYSTSGLVDTYRISYNDGTTSTFTITNGAKGDKGDNQYVWIKYASQKPTASSHSFGDVPDNWIGIYAGASSTAPTDWQEYSWFQIKGEKGDTGAAATVLSNVVEYQVGDSGTIIPSGAWGTSIPVVAQGKYLWTRVTTTFNSGSSAVSYSVSRMGLDGSGSVVSVANISPDENGNVPLTAEDLNALPTAGGTMTGGINMSGQKLNGLNEPTADDEAATKGSSESFANKKITDRVIYSGGKNLLPSLKLMPEADQDLAYTFNKDGTITVNGTPSKQAYFAKINTILPAGTYIISGNPTANSTIGTNDIIVYARPDLNSDWVQVASSYGSVQGTFTLEETSYIWVKCRTNTGATYNNTIWYPMIRLASETDATYEPHYKGLAALTNNRVLLWENSSPSSSFPAQDLQVDTSNYGSILVEFCNTNTTNVILTQSIDVADVKADQVRYLPLLMKNSWDDSANGITVQDCIRTVEIRSNRITIYDAVRMFFHKNTTGANYANTTNTVCIPVRIYGIKGVS